MYEFSLSQALFSAKKEVILLTGIASKMTNTVQTGSKVASSYRPSGSKGAAKYNGVARALDMVLVNKSVKALEGSDFVYCEIEDAGKIMRVQCDGLIDMYEGDRLHGFAKFVPLMMYELRSDSSNTELKTVYENIKKDFAATGTASLNDLLLFCDCFYYAVAAPKKDNYCVYDNHLEMSTIREAVREGRLVEMPAMKGVNDAPDVINLKDTYSSEGDSTANKGISTHTFLDDVKAGKFITPFDWNEEQKSKIQPLSFLDNFVPGPEFATVVNKISYRTNKIITRMDAGLKGADAIDKDYINMIFMGKPGTGKTTLAYALGAATGMPVYTVTLDKKSESDTFTGKTVVVDGQLQFVKTEFLDAFTNGGIVVLEEINLPNPELLKGTIGSAIEFPFVLMENECRPVPRHPLCIVIGTMNLDTFAGTEIDQAVASRFKSKYILNDPEKDTFIKILMKTGHQKSVCEWVYNIFSRILTTVEATDKDICLDVTMRGCLGCLDEYEEGVPLKKAVETTLINSVALRNQELAKQLVEAIGSIPLPR